MSWRAVVRWTAALLFVLTAVVAVARGDREAIVIALVLLVANVALRWRSGRLGLVLAVLVALDIAFWMIPAAWVNVSEHEGVAAIAVPTVLAVAALTLITAAAFEFSGADDGRAPAVLIGVAVLIVVGSIAVGELGDPVERQAGDVEVDLSDTAFEPDQITVASGDVAFFVTNQDLFWHTFTIEDTDVDVRLPVSGHRRITTRLEPGEYELICAIPGHETVGMVGTIRVE